MRFPRVRVSVRFLMVVVLVAGGGLGWLAHLLQEGRIQREAVDAVESAGGTVVYDWQLDGTNLKVKPGTNLVVNEVPGWPKWLVDRLGGDCFSRVDQITIGRRNPHLSPWNRKEEAEDGLAKIGRIRGLKKLVLLGLPVSDASLTHLEGMSSLEVLFLRGCDQVTDDGMAHLEKLSGLKQLFLEHTAVGDEGLKRLRGLDRLETINLGRTRVSNEGLAHLQGLTHLETVGLDSCRVGGPPLAAFLQGRTRLTGLYLSDTQVTDQDLIALKGMDRLGWLGLRNNTITDAGLASLKGLTSLQSLDLHGTKVTRDGIADLQSALPAAKIEWDAP